MTQLLYFLPFVACPVAMGGMMFFMMRGSKQPETLASNDSEVAALRREVDDLRTKHRSEA